MSEILKYSIVVLVIMIICVYFASCKSFYVDLIPFHPTIIDALKPEISTASPNATLLPEPSDSVMCDQIRPRVSSIVKGGATSPLIPILQQPCKLHVSSSLVSFYLSRVLSLLLFC
jgi:hypothetical protein